MAHQFNSFPRVQSVVLPILRARFPEWEEFQIGSWIEDIDFRKFPIINVRRFGGFRHLTRPMQLDKPIIEMTVYSEEDIETAEQVYTDALSALFEAWKRQTPTPNGYVHSVKETLGMTQFSSPFMDSWRVQGLIQIGIRPNP